ncbi:MAG: UPF0182 family protein [Bryobacterales bacterium]|nr:UPF0182 family protein [Bryobacteraceae bacterium]MDW8354775.1 UPF0182 family protein [Bryobacterales bacterium]
MARRIPVTVRRRVSWRPLLLVAALIVVLSARLVARYVIEYQWWRELNQVPTWVSMLLYGVAPVAAATVLAFLVLWAAHARALKFAGTSLRYHPRYAFVSTVALFLIALALASATIDTWTVVLYFGGRGLPAEATQWRDAIFNLPLRFYLFDLPFYSLLRRYVLALAVVAALVYWAAARGWQIYERIPEFREMGEIDPRLFRLEGALESRFLRGAGAVFLLGLAAQFFLGRYEMLVQDHGFMVGMDYVAEKIALPLQWLVIAACVAAAAAVWMGRWRLALVLPAALVLRLALPPAVNALYVKPNEISIQRPYIQTHIHATRSAFGLEHRAREVEFPARLEARIDVAKHAPLLDNVRLWDWRAFHDTVTQIQALRPYYVFADTDVDRYVIDGKLRQVLLTPRELDIRQLADARARWINPHFIYTHGYGMVMAEANRITSDGLPVLFVQDAPPQVKTNSLKLTRPEIYYGEVVHEPVFVRTAQEEFSYPSGADNVFTRYQGRGGFPIAPLWLRVAAAIRYGDYNILLTGYLTPESRMMIRRNVRQRLATLAGFITWDPDPYLVLTEDGRLVWTVDGYTTSNAHPYSASIRLGALGTVNYVRNSVKATVDAYSGETRLYIFDPSDPIIQAYQRIFPELFLPASAMPPDLRAHVRYPETYFRAQAEIYRTFHMLDPQAFYNKEDVWDIARNVQGQDTRPTPLSPTYVVATLPGESEPEFLLVLPFTPRNKDNMIGLMVARCDGPHLGELLFLLLSKQELIFGPMQIEARINQDQNISKDLTLWNQQGSQVLRGQILVLPVENTFLYVEPIYIQAAEARMPQLKKVVLAMGNLLIYRDTYEQALAELAGFRETAPVLAASAAPPAVPAAQAADRVDPLEAVRQHLRRYRELAAQGRWAEAGKELEALEALAERR